MYKYLPRKSSSTNIKHGGCQTECSDRSCRDQRAGPAAVGVLGRRRERRTVYEAELGYGRMTPAQKGQQSQRKLEPKRTHAIRAFTL